MTLDEYKAKMNDIKTRGADAARAGRLDEAEALKNEAESTQKAFEAEKAAAAEKAAFNMAKPAPVGFIGAACKVDMEEKNNMTEMTNARGSQDYRNAFLKTLTGRDLTDSERSAYQMVNTDYPHTTTDGVSAILPVEMQDKIWSLIGETHAILGDITTLRSGVVLDVPVHKAVVAGKGKKTTEGTAPDDEQNTFATVRLAGNDYAKVVKLSYAAKNMALDSLESYLVQEIGSQLADAMAADAITSIEGAIDTGNKVTGTATFANITKTFGTLKRTTGKTVYCTSYTLYNVLANLADTSGRLIFVPNANEDVAGTLLGAPVKIEDGVADNVILVGDPSRVVNNVVTDVMVETDRDIAAHKFIYSGYARAEAALVDTQSFAMLTVSAS